jgi:hypothetical protein
VTSFLEGLAISGSVMIQNPYIVFVYRIVICFIEYSYLHHGKEILREIKPVKLTMIQENWEFKQHVTDDRDPWEISHQN